VLRPRPTRKRGVGLFGRNRARSSCDANPSFRRGAARTAPQSTCELSLHPRPDCKQVACKYRPTTSQIAGFTDCSSLESAERGASHISLGVVGVAVLTARHEAPRRARDSGNRPKRPSGRSADNQIESGQTVLPDPAGASAGSRAQARRPGSQTEASQAFGLEECRGARRLEKSRRDCLAATGLASAPAGPCQR
jgi:hypothetical protein